MGFTVVRYCVTTDSSERPPLLHVPQGAAQDAYIGVRLHKDLDVQQVTQLLVLKNQDTLHDHYLGGAHLHRLVGAVVNGIVVYGTVDGLAPLQCLQVGDHQIGVKGVGMVVVLLAPLLKGAILPLVVVIVVYHADIAAEPCGQMLGESGLAAAGAAGDTDKNGVHVLRPPKCSALIIGNGGAKSKRRGAALVKKA